MTSPIEKISGHLRIFSLAQTHGVGVGGSNAENALRSSSAELLEYSVCGRNGDEIALVQELGKAGLGLHLTKHYYRFYRAIELNVLDPSDKVIFSISKPEHFLSYKAVVNDSQGRTIGTVKKFFNPFIRTYQLRGGDSNLFIRSPIIKPWTFPVFSGKREVAKITKSMPSLGQFMTERETLKVKSYLTSPVGRCLILAASILISANHFERY